MPNDRLLDELAADLRPVTPRRAGRDLLLFGVIGGIELGLFLLFGAARHDIMIAMTLPSFWWRLGSLAALSVTAGITAVRSFDPSVSPRKGLRLVPGLVGAALAIGWVIDAASAGGAALWARLMWHHGVDCVFAMVVLSIPPILALGLLMRRGAPTDRQGSAWAVGVASAAWGALVFVFNCRHDDPFYVAVWYLAGCAIVSLIARLVLPRMTRW